MRKFAIMLIFFISILTACTSTLSNREDAFNNKNWAINHVILNKEHTPSGKKIKIAILDSGITKTKELESSIIYSYNTFDDTEVTDDKYGHGTMIASVIAAESNNSIKVGVNSNVEILDIQVLDEKGIGSKESVVKGIYKAIEKNVDVINLSIGFSNNNSDLEEVIKMAIDKGIIVVASSGNTMGSHTDYPAKYKDVISVSAIDNNNKKYIHAGSGKIDFVAPGVDIPVIDKTSKLSYQSGTSFAAAFFTGIVSLYLKDGETIEYKFLQEKSTKLGEDFIYGNGLLKYKK